MLTASGLAPRRTSARNGLAPRGLNEGYKPIQGRGSSCRIRPILENPSPIELPVPPPERRRVPPSLAERYEDIQFVGEGGMGTVYRAMDPRLGRAVALKLLKGDDPELWRRFIGEARSQARIQHDNVCRVYEAGQADGEPYIAMQYTDGEPLSKMAARLPLEQRIKQMCEVSAAVHEASMSTTCPACTPRS